MSRRRALSVLGAVSATALLIALAVGTAGQATHSPANKVWVAADTVQYVAKSVAQNVPSEIPDQVVLFTAKVKYSNPTDVRLSVTAECALWTNTATTGDDDSESKARVEVWITIDGKVVPVSAVAAEPDPGASNPLLGPNDPDNQAGKGRVVFCNRAARMKTELIESAPGGGDDSDTEDDVRIRSYNRSRTANAFNWGALNVGRDYDDVVTQNGKNLVVIEVHARLAASLTDVDTSDNNGVDSPAARAAIGKRTLFVEPVKMANDATF